MKFRSVKQDRALTYPTHQARSIISINSTLPRVSYPCHITLSPEKDRVDERLWFIEVVEQKDSRSNEAKEDGQVIRDQVFRDYGSHLNSAMEPAIAEGRALSLV